MVLYMVLWVLLLGGSVTSTTPRPAIEHSPRAGGQFHDLAITLLANSEARLKDKEYLPLEGEKFFVARFSCAEVVARYGDPAVFETSPLHAAITRATQTVVCTFNTCLEPECEWGMGEQARVHVDVSDTVDRLKEKIGVVVGLSVGEFRIFRKSGSGVSQHKKEMVDMSRAMRDEAITWGAARNRVVVMKGRPPRQGVHTVKLVWLERHDNGLWTSTRDGGTLDVLEAETVAQVKSNVIRTAAAEARPGGEAPDRDENGMDTPHLRLRDDRGFAGAGPRKILVDELPLGGSSGQVNHPLSYWSLYLSPSKLGMVPVKSSLRWCVVVMRGVGAGTADEVLDQDSVCAMVAGPRSQDRHRQRAVGARALEARCLGARTAARNARGARRECQRRVCSIGQVDRHPRGSLAAWQEHVVGGYAPRSTGKPAVGAGCG